MVEQQPQQQATGVAVRQSVVVDAPQERAFAVFTRMTGWWPLHSHTIGGRPAAEAVVEPREGGRWFERSADGSECDWGRVLTWDPPHRVVLAWQISADWTYDPSIDTEVEVRFSPEGAARTRVDLEHRGLEAFGERTDEMRQAFESDGGWPLLLGRYAADAKTDEAAGGA
jgi:uncharacterized protein YndB with AHSA1/START domain